MSKDLFDMVELSSMQWNRTSLIKSEENMPNLVGNVISKDIIDQVKAMVASK